MKQQLVIPERLSADASRRATQYLLAHLARAGQSVEDLHRQVVSEVPLKTLYGWLNMNLEPQRRWPASLAMLFVRHATGVNYHPFDSTWRFIHRGAPSAIPWINEILGKEYWLFNSFRKPIELCRRVRASQQRASRVREFGRFFFGGFAPPDLMGEYLRRKYEGAKTSAAVEGWRRFEKHLYRDRETKAQHENRPLREFYISEADIVRLLRREGAFQFLAVADVRRLMDGVLGSIGDNNLVLVISPPTDDRGRAALDWAFNFPYVAAVGDDLLLRVVIARVDSVYATTTVRGAHAVSDRELDRRMECMDRLSANVKYPHTAADSFNMLQNLVDKNLTTDGSTA